MSLPVLYAAWVEELIGRAPPTEARATCDDCAMCRKPGTPDSMSYFQPDVKCCSYHPWVPNFLVGRMVATGTTGTTGTAGTAETLRSAGASVRLAVERRVGVSPLGLEQPASYRLVYERSPHVFGVARDLVCPHFVAEGGGGSCGIWANRPAICATWFCKFERGAVGEAFWSQLRDLLVAVEQDLALWCALEAGNGSLPLEALIPRPGTSRVEAVEVGGPFDEARHQRVWGEWAGREGDFFRRCADLVTDLTSREVLARCGPRVRAFAEQARAAYARLATPRLPDRLTLGALKALPSGSDKLRAMTYRGSDPIDVSPQLATALGFFRGQPLEDALGAIKERLGLSLSPALLQRLVDFALLVEVQNPDERGAG